MRRFAPILTLASILHGSPAGARLFTSEHGLELIWIWRLAAAVDLADRYSNVSLSLGFWH